MAFDAAVCVTKTSQICVTPCKISAFYLFCHLPIAKIWHSVHCNNKKCLTS